MIFTRTPIDGVFRVDVEPAEDARGSFARAWSVREFAEMGLATDFPEINFSSSSRRGTIRGLHYQAAPHQEAKFVRCIRGALFDVVVDLRPDSPTRYRWAGFEIRASLRQSIYIPGGCAHGVKTLEDDTEMLYMVSACYQPGAEFGIRWDDPFFDISWPDPDTQILSDKDRSWPDFRPAAEALIVSPKI
jgi:dTDP-4-dehydrorhamnose 3,5-epimerase